MAKKSKIVNLALLVMVIVSVGVLAWYFISRDEPDISPVVNNQPASQEDKVDINEPEDKPAEYVTTFNADALQTAVDSWDSSNGGGSASVVIIDPKDGTTLANLNADDPFFAASLYKLYVAYEGYKQVDAGTVDPNEVYQGGRTRAECLDVMIRDSDSPCGEKLWAEIGKQKLTQTLESYGIENTDMTALRTTAVDTSMMLQKISNGKGLSKESQEAYLDSMKTQDAMYRRGLPSGFSDSVTVYNKVGWNEQLEYHDAAIVELADGRRVVVVVLTSSVGSRSIAQLAESLEAVLSE